MINRHCRTSSASSSSTVVAYLKRSVGREGFCWMNNDIRNRGDIHHRYVFCLLIVFYAIFSEIGVSTRIKKFHIDQLFDFNIGQINP